MLTTKGYGFNYTQAIRDARMDCTCQKRVVVCIIAGRDGSILSVGSNQCKPEGGACCQLSVVNHKRSYPVATLCHSVHAEANAVDALPEGAEPWLALVLGHDFACPDCEALLQSVGIPPESIKAGYEWNGCGLRRGDD